MESCTPLPLSSILLLFAGFTATACGSVPLQNRLHTDPAGLATIHQSEHLLVLRRPGSPGLADRRDLVFERVVVRYTDGVERVAGDLNVDWGRRQFEDALVRDLEAGGYRVLDQVEDRTLRLVVCVYEIDPAEPATSSPSIEAELFDASSGRREALVLVRPEDRAKRRVVQTSWDERTDMLAAWANDLRRALDIALR